VVDEGGLGRLLPFWAGPEDQDVAGREDDVGDPDGASDANYLLSSPV